MKTPPYIAHPPFLKILSNLPSIPVSFNPQPHFYFCLASTQQYICVLDEFWMNDYNFHQVLIHQQSGCISQ